MKKISISLCLLAVAVFALSSCKEDKVKDVTLTVNLEQTSATKAHLNANYTPVIVTGDSAYVNDGVFAFDFENGNPILRVNHAADNRYRAIFPANIVDVNANPDIANTNNVTVNIPFIQTYDKEGNDQKVDMPMISYPEGYALWFRNICSLVKVNVTNVSGRTITLGAIQVSNNTQGQSGQSSVYLAGNTRVNVASSYPEVTVAEDQYRFVQLNFNGHQDAVLADGATGSYYLIIAPFSGATDGINVRLISSNYNFNDISFPNATSLPRNTVAVVNVNANL